MATIIKSDGTTENVFPKDKEHFTLEELQAHVGGFFQLVHVPSLNMKINFPEGRYFLCNEDGIAMQLPYNLRASTLAGQQILGDVLICNAKEFK